MSEAATLNSEDLPVPYCCADVETHLTKCFVERLLLFLWIFRLELSIRQIMIFVGIRREQTFERVRGVRFMTAFGLPTLRSPSRFPIAVAL